MTQKIMVALDGSDGGQRALAAAIEHARLTSSYIIDWTPYSFHTPEELEQRHQRRESEIQRANDSILMPNIGVVEAAGIKLETLVRHGRIAETLIDLTKEFNISQIYIGKRGESRVHTMIFGSVTAALIQTSTVPVTVVP